LLNYTINIMRKGNLAPSSAMDQVQNYVLGGIIGCVIYNDSVTILQFVLVLIIWTLLVLILKFLKEHNRYIKVLVNGNPLTLIQDGQLTIIEFGGENIKYPIIVDGQSNFDVLELINKDESWLEQEIIKQGYDRINDVYLGEYLSGELKLYGYQT